MTETQGKSISFVSDLVYQWTTSVPTHLGQEPHWLSDLISINDMREWVISTRNDLLQMTDLERAKSSPYLCNRDLVIGTLEPLSPQCRQYWWTTRRPWLKPINFKQEIIFYNLMPKPQPPWSQTQDEGNGSFHFSWLSIFFVRRGTTRHFKNILTHSP